VLAEASGEGVPAELHADAKAATTIVVAAKKA
jgi:hypothetical protein